MINEFQGNDGKTYAWLDSDTVTDGATSYRLKGFNALETPHVFEDEEGNLRFKQGQQGGKAQTEATKRIAAAGGFTNIVDDGEEDKFGRKLISLQDEYGNELSDTLYQSGLLTVDKYTTEDGLKARQYGELEREAGIANPYASIAQEEMPEKPIYMKDTPILEQAFGEIPLDENSYAQQVIQVIANQNGLNLSNPDDMREASKYLIQDLTIKEALHLKTCNLEVLIGLKKVWLIIRPLLLGIKVGEAWLLVGKALQKLQAY